MHSSYSPRTEKTLTPLERALKQNYITKCGNCIGKHNFAQFASMPTKQWLPIEVGNEIVMHFLLSFISSLDFKSICKATIINKGNFCLIGQFKSQDGRRWREAVYSKVLYHIKITNGNIAVNDS